MMVADKNETSADASRAVHESRRRSVRNILGVGGVVAGGQLASGGWVKPVVDTVMMPAHAQTSVTGVEHGGSVDDPCLITLTCTGYRQYDIQVDGFVVPATPGVNVEIEIAFNNGSFAPFAQTTTDGNGEYQASGSESNVLHSSVQVRVTLPDYPEAGTAECSIDISDSDSLNPGGSYTTVPTSSYFCDYYYSGNF